MTQALLDRLAEPATYIIGDYGPEVVFDPEGPPVPGYRRFSDRSWAASGEIALLVSKDAENWWLGNADFFEEEPGVALFVLATEADSMGSLAADDAVIVTAVLTADALALWLARQPVPTWISDVSTSQGLSVSTLTAGMLVRATNSSGVTLTLPSDAPEGWWVRVLRSGSGTVTIAPPGGGTINGAGSSVDISAQWKMVEVFRQASNAFLVPNL